MNIIFGQENAKLMADKYTVLELDTVCASNKGMTLTAYCTVENIPLDQMITLSDDKKLHENLIHCYKNRNWNQCFDNIEQLMGKWGGELDSFYHELQNRIIHLQIQNLDGSWTSTLIKSA